MSTDNQEFKAGDVVELKSGGPNMTISEKAPNNTPWVCHWFKKNEMLKSNFLPTSLTISKSLRPTKIIIMGADEKP